MSIIQPQSTDELATLDHAKLHRVIASDENAPDESISVDASGNVGVSGTVDGRDLATDGSKLDGIESGADITDAGNVGSSIHGATEKTTPVDADEVGLIDSAASYVLKKLSLLNLKKTMLADGWVEIAGDWTASDANSISINADLTSLLQKGTKLKLTNNSAVKYFYITTTPAFGAGATTFDVTGETDLVAGAITLPYYSYADSPFGFKKGQDWYRCLIHRSAVQSIPNSTGTQVQYDLKTYDPNNNYSTVTYKYTVPISGIYQINFGAGYDNGSSYRVLNDLYGATNGLRTDCSAAQIAIPASKTQYLTKGQEIYVKTRQDSGGSVNLMSLESITFLSIQFLAI